VNLTQNAASDSRPSWSPDGSKIAFQSDRDGNLEIYVTNADGSGAPVNLSQNAAADTRPSWSPDGTRIAFTTDRNPGDVEIFVMSSADGSGQTDLAGISTADDRLEAWSPDGNWIVFTSDRNSTASAYNNEIYKRNLGTQVETRLTNNPADDTMPDWQRLP
jgi:Tol biopolymer transport system component